MTKAEAYEKAWTLGFRGDFSMVDQIYHPKYRAIQKNINVEVDLDSDKIVVSTISEYNTPGPVRVIFENDDFLLIERYFKSTLTETPAFNVGMTAVKYLDGKIITQETIGERDLPDPSEGEDWNWEDYE
jgi:hypothetical protein